MDPVLFAKYLEFKKMSVKPTVWDEYKIRIDPCLTSVKEYFKRMSAEVS